jgi:hypothetical protein
VILVVVPSLWRSLFRSIRFAAEFRTSNPIEVKKGRRMEKKKKKKKERKEEKSKKKESREVKENL